MNPDHLPTLLQSLRALGDYAARHDVNNVTLPDIGAELDRARALVASARGAALANNCPKHPGGPVDPTARNGCLLCGNSEHRPAARPVPQNFVPGEVLRYLQEHGQDAATEQYGAQAVTRALVLGARHPCAPQPDTAAGPDTDESETA